MPAPPEPSVAPAPPEAATARPLPEGTVTPLSADLVGGTRLPPGSPSATPS
jgi:hypothetical protein